MLEFDPPSLYVYIGPSGVGKTLLGKMVSEKLGTPFYDIDAVRRQLFPDPPHIPTTATGLTKQESEDLALQASHDKLHRLAGMHLLAGESVSIGKTLRQESHHEIIRTLAERHGALLKVVSLTAPFATRLARVLGRQSGDHFVTTEEQLRRQAEGSATYPNPTVSLDTSLRSPEDSAAYIVEKLKPQTIVYPWATGRAS